jgi:hypothetical protein
MTLTRGVLSCVQNLFGEHHPAQTGLLFCIGKQNCLDFRTIKYLYSALIQCHLDYACSSWNQSLNKRFKSKLQICQNKIVTFIHGMGPRDSVNNVILANMSLLNVENRNKQSRLNHVFKIVNNQCPSYMKKCTCY